MSEDAPSDSQDLVPSEGQNNLAPVSRLIRRGLDDLCIDEGRMLRFPPDRSVGEIVITEGKWRGFVIGDARGDISVRAMLKKACQVSDDEMPPDQDLKWQLFVPEELSPVDLSPLQYLRPDDIQDLSVPLEPGRITCHGGQLAYLQHMTGLKKL